MNFTCCIGMSKGPDDESSHRHQRTLSLVQRDPKIPRDRDDRPPMTQSGTPRQYANATIASTTASALEDSVCSRLERRGAAVAVAGVVGGDEEGEDFDDPVQIYSNDDAHLLRCRPVLAEDGGEGPAPTIFGIGENAASLGGATGNRNASPGSVPVRVTLLDPRCDRAICASSGREQKHKSNDCCCHHPRGSWMRQKVSLNSSNTHQLDAVNGGTQSSIPSYHANVKIIDLTKIQDSRRSVGTDELYPCFDTPGRVFHLLRSVLNCSRNTIHRSGGLHCASPWNRVYCSGEMTRNKYVPDGEDCAADQVVALLVKDPSAKQNEWNGTNSQFWDDVEQREVDEFLGFRTGDAAPSYFLHSTSQLSGGSKFLSDTLTHSEDATLAGREETLVGGCSSSSSLLLVYRQLPPRDVLSRHHSRYGEKCEYGGCLRETYFENVNESDLGSGSEPRAQTPQLVKHRMVSPPYLSHEQEYPGLLDSLLKSITFITEEAKRIPQWTAWPEQNHYSDTSWNVFPLCYTFPANDISQRKWIQKTCSFVPETTKLLRALGPFLRTALFSRLDPRSRLGTHTGWSDLANHVLRVHIPLVVPGGKCANRNMSGGGNYNAGLCGTWVDGCVETHDEGRIIAFDDSKVHRAFNYSDEERIVLIIDLLRPRDLPMGTATGGHSDELDAFINAF